MAKILPVIAAMAGVALTAPLAVAADVQAVPAVNVASVGFQVLPEKLTSDYAAKLVLSDVDWDTGVMTVYIYDNDLKFVKKFSTPAQQKVSATYIASELLEYSGEWVSDERTEAKASVPVDFNYYSTSGEEVPLSVVQRLFASGDVYVYPLLVAGTINVDYEFDSNDDGVIDRKSSGQRAVFTGIRLMADNGSTIATIDFPEGLVDMLGHSLDICNLDGKLVIAPRLSSIDAVMSGRYEYADYTVLYSVDVATGSVKQVAAPMLTRVAPTTPRQGTPVGIDLPENTDGAEILLTSASGQVVRSMKVAAGRTDAVIDTSALSQGLYVVSVKTGDKTVENTKIIVR